MLVRDHINKKGSSLVFSQRCIWEQFSWKSEFSAFPSSAFGKNSWEFKKVDCGYYEGRNYTKAYDRWRQFSPVAVRFNTPNTHPVTNSDQPNVPLHQVLGLKESNAGQHTSIGTNREWPNLWDAWNGHCKHYNGQVQGQDKRARIQTSPKWVIILKTEIQISSYSKAGEDQVEAKLTMASIFHQGKSTHFHHAVDQLHCT
jgi:hypothetical protein